MTALPPGARLPFWATREFRFLVIVMVMAFAGVAVMVFEIMPMLEKKETARVRQANTSGRPSFAPAPPGTAPELRFDGILQKVVDGSPAHDLDEPYWRLVRYLTTVENKTLSDQSVYVDHPLFVKHAAELRGRPVRATGLHVGTESSRPDSPAKAG